jgi:hypothetical protein
MWEAAVIAMESLRSVSSNNSSSSLQSSAIPRPSQKVDTKEKISQQKHFWKKSAKKSNRATELGNSLALADLGFLPYGLTVRKTMI